VNLEFSWGWLGLPVVDKILSTMPPPGSNPGTFLLIHIKQHDKSEFASPWSING